MTRNLPLLAIGTLGLGIVGLGFGDFALQWQPVPADIPMRPILAILTALVMVVVATLSVAKPTRVAGAWALFALFTVWTVLLKVPGVLAAPGNMVSWLGLGELGALAAGGLATVAMARSEPPANFALASRLILGVCALIFGASHFVYAKFTAAMVPAWLPAPLFWAYFTGACHTAAGFALVSGVLARLAAMMLAIMCMGFAILLHLPRVVATPGVHAEWVMLFVATSIAGAAWAVHELLARVERPAA